MKERPILFSGPMVLSILDGRKTQTRRVVKPQFSVFHSIHADASISTNRLFRGEDQRIRCPYGQPGDRLWVKETWCAWDTYMENVECDEVAGNAQHLIETGITRHHITYRADPERHASKWRPSIFMPRWASRITLEIVRVRVERLQDISAGDAISEGLSSVTDGAAKWGIPGIPEWSNDPREAYGALWRSINGHGSWDSNPWVWVIEFKKL